MIQTAIPRIAMILALAVLCSGCALFGRGGASPSHLRSSEPVQDDNREEQLRALVSDVLNAEVTASSEASARLVEKRPYFFREYVSYPDGISDYELTTAASDLKSTPYVATVKLDKERHSTLLSRKRKDAMQDDIFYASRGYETRTFELRHGRWRETGSVYIAEEGNPVPRRIRTRQGDEASGGGGGFVRRLMFWRDE